MSSAIHDLLASRDGHEEPGGCDDCDAYQRLRLVERGFFMITTYHDDDCPTLARHEGLNRAERRARRRGR